MSASCEVTKLFNQIKSIVPKLVSTKHKGQYGRIGVIGGSLEYTGAPYFSAITAIKVGSDLAHIFCQRDAAVVIKSYSPELIVHPVLDAVDAVSQVSNCLDGLHVIVIGPGLGKDTKIQESVVNIIKLCLQMDKPMIIDADGLSILNTNLDLIRGQKKIILTPNAIEFSRLFGSNPEMIAENIKSLGSGITVLQKGYQDKIYTAGSTDIYELPSGGSGRRCGGQGDILCGSLATFYHWALQSNSDSAAFEAAYAASFLTKECNSYAFKKYGRSMVAGDMVNEVHNVFADYFECKDCK